NSEAVFRATIWLLPYLALWFVLPRMRAQPDPGFLSVYVLGATVGCIGAAAFALFDIAVLEQRPAGGAGNSAVFANMALFLTGFAGLAITDAGRWPRFLAYVGVVCGSLAVILSQTRGVAIALVPVLLLLLIY